MKIVPLLFNRRWWWATLLVIAGMLVMVRLGLWQLDRLEQRRAANVRLRQQLAAEPISLNEVDPESVDLPSMADRQVTATGKFDFSEQIVLKLQNFQGSPGVHLVAPLRLQGSDQAVLVDRGWLPNVESAPENLSKFDEPGTVTVRGVIRRTQTARNAEPPSEPQREWFRINVEAIERQVSYELLPIYVLQAPAEGSQRQTLPLRAEPEVDVSEGPHLSYAVQWFIFSLMLGGGYLYLVHKKVEEEATEAQSPDARTAQR